MDFVALVSGGKDSVYSIMESLSHGHRLVCVANLRPQAVHEADSFMYQSVGAEAVQYLANCLEVPLVQGILKGASIQQGLDYQVQAGDEVEDLYELLQKVLEQFPSVQAVSSGAILSHYQRIRIENVADRLGLTSLSYLWQRDQSELLHEMVESGLDARLVKVCSMGLTKDHLMQPISILQPHFEKIHKRFGFNVCGEGGEYETLVLDAPIFRNFSVSVNENHTVLHDNHTEDQHVAYSCIDEAALQPKMEDMQIEAIDWILRRSHQVEQNKQNRMEQKYEYEEYQQNNEPTSSDLDSLPMTNHSPVYYHHNPFLHTGLLNTQMIDQPTESDADQLTHLLDYLQHLFESVGMSMKQHCVYILLLVPDISQFAPLNKIYKQYFGSQPPVRITLQHCLSHVSIMAIGCLHTEQFPRRNLHVQSISHWAPANIGPYSQANWINSSRLYLAGQIGMLPENLELVHGIKEQYQQTIYNQSQVISTFTHSSQWQQYVKSQMVFVKQSLTQDIVEFIYQNSPVTKNILLVQMERFPKDALVESEIYLETQDNDQTEPQQVHLLTLQLENTLAPQIITLLKQVQGLDQAARLDIFVPKWLTGYPALPGLVAQLHPQLIVCLLPVHQVYSPVAVPPQHICLGLRLAF